MDPIYVGILTIVLVLILITLGIPISFSLGLSGLLGILIMREGNIVFKFMISLPYSTISSWALVIIPLFMLMGHLAYHAGITDDAYEMGYKWLGRIHGGLAMATTFASAMFAATSGSSVAVAAAMSKIAIPQMRKYGYNTGFAVGCVAVSGTLGILIPPSGVLVVYGILTEQSIGKLLIAGMVPGIMSAIVFMLGCYVLARFFKMGGPKPPPIKWKEKILALKLGIGVLLLFGTVMGGIYSGIFTSIEAAGFGVTVALVMLLIRSKSRLTGFSDSMKTTSKSSCMVLTVFIGAAVFSLNLTMTGIPQEIATFLVNLDMPSKLKIAMILIPYIPLGMFLDPISMMVLTLPLIYPVVQALGFSGIWFGILVTKMIEISLITPPVGLNIYVVKAALPDVSIGEILKGCGPFLFMDFINLAILFAFPEISLFLQFMMG